MYSAEHPECMYVHDDLINYVGNRHFGWKYIGIDHSKIYKQIASLSVSSSPFLFIVGEYDQVNQVNSCGFQIIHK